jgi:hypothetical protein
MDGWWWIVAAACVLLVGGGLLLVWRPARAALRASELATARGEFHRQRERLEARFVQIAGASGKPRGLSWSNCEFDDAVTYARDRRTGQLSAFVAVTISFEAVEGGGMEHVEAVSNLRAATAVFHYVRGVWQTEGRAVFNLNPAEAIDHFRGQLERLDHETPRV